MPNFEATQDPIGTAKIFLEHVGGDKIRPGIGTGIWEIREEDGAWRVPDCGYIEAIVSAFIEGRSGGATPTAVEQVLEALPVAYGRLIASGTFTSQATPPVLPRQPENKPLHAHELRDEVFRAFPMLPYELQIGLVALVRAYRGQWKP
jgi:hypothetical protein